MAKKIKKKVVNRILVVDDEEDTANMLADFLNKKGYETDIALDGREAIDKVKEERPHIVLLDIKMPGMDGIEALQKIREIDKEVGVIMVTALEDDAVGKKCVEMGAYDYITKPLSLEYLEGVLMVKLLDF
jgi:DNA-binding response OmpR family regulator